MKNAKKYSNISCAILAGGKNSRFGGRDKAFIEIEWEYHIKTRFMLSMRQAAAEVRHLN